MLAAAIEKIALFAGVFGTSLRRHPIAAVIAGGATNFTTVLVAEQNVFQAESNLAIATGNAALGLIATYRALGGGWQIRKDGYFVDARTNAQIRARANWGKLLPPAESPQPEVPGLPSPADVGPTVRLPEW